MVMGMAKYADITPFYEWLDSVMKEDNRSYPDHNTLMFYEIIDELDSLTEVVRCKDCRHRGEWCCPMYYEEEIEWDDDGYIEADYVPHDRTMDDGFCDRGERREGE